MAKKNSALKTGGNTAGFSLVEARKRKLTKRDKNKQLRKKAKKLPSGWKILKRSLLYLYSYKKLFLGISLTYGLLLILFVRGLSTNLQFEVLRQNLTDIFAGGLSSVGETASSLGVLFSTLGSSSSDAGSVYQMFIVLIVSLSLIWSIRQTYSRKVKLRIRDGFYKGMYSLVPFLLVLFFILLNLLPFVIAGSLYDTILTTSLAVSGPEQLLWAGVFIAGFAWSIYLVSGSIFGLYIVTLPNTQPRAALKSARKLVRFRRGVVIRRLLFLPFMLFCFSTLALIPMVFIFAPIAEFTFLIFSFVLPAVVHGYLYTLYRELL